MVNVVTTVKEWVTIDTLLYACDGGALVPQAGYQTSYAAKTTITSNAPTESRSLPARPLWKHPTAQPTQSTTVEHAGFVETSKAITSTGGGCVSGKRTRVTRFMPTGKQTNSSLTPAYVDPDWVTPLRLQINAMKVNLGQDLAEYRQTADMFRDAARAVVRAKHRYTGQSRKKRKPLSICSVAASDIIYGFGIAPLLGTMFDSYIALRAKLTHPTTVKFVQNAQSKVPYNGNLTSTKTVFGYKTRSVRAKVYIQFSPNTSLFTLGNPLSLAWELVPYSFVFDYMIPFGDYLSTLDAMVGTMGTWGTLTTRDTDKYHRIERPADVSRTIALENTYKSHKRDVITDIPLPPFPKWKPSASWHKLRHAVSLLVLNRCKTRNS